jgi:isoleucyl-tRNA synthetase
MRFYLVSSPVMAAESLNFSEESVKETYGKLVNTLWNVFEFYQLFAKELPHKMPFKSAHVLDRWIMAKLHETVREVTEHMEGYRLPEASRPILDFVTELSQWYVRRSRERVKGADELDKHNALYTLREVLLVLSKLVAPFTPFIAEKLYQELKQEEEGGKAWAKESVHLEHWPRLHDEHHDQSVIEEMLVARKIVEMGLALRAESGIKVRQPLGTLAINNEHLSKELHTMIAEELNVKTIDICEVVEGDGWKLKEDGDLKVWLNTTLDEALKKEGVVRDIIRAINQLRKESGLTINDRIKLYYQTPTNFEEVWKNSADQIKAATLAADLVASDSLAEAEVKIGEEKVKLKIETI